MLEQVELWNVVRLALQCDEYNTLKEQLSLLSKNTQLVSTVQR